MMLKPDDLLVLLEVARSGTLSAAGAALGIDHSTVSRRLSALETELGQPVLSRSAHGSEVTDFGRALLDRAERIEQAMVGIRDVDAPVNADHPQFSGLVRVLAPEAFGACFVAPVLARMHHDHPAVNLELVTATRPLVQGAGADIEIGVGEPVSRRIETFTLADYTLGLYAAPHYLAAHGAPTSVADLADHSLIYYIDALLRVSDLDLIDQLFPQGAVNIGSTSVHAQAAATRAGGGLGVLPNFLVHGDNQLIRLLPEEVSIELHLTAAVAPRVLRRPAAVEVMRRIQREVTVRRRELWPNRPSAQTSAVPVARAGANAPTPGGDRRVDPRQPPVNRR
jgi:DNA-binding transcriptional LysR family regulator